MPTNLDNHRQIKSYHKLDYVRKNLDKIDGYSYEYFHNKIDELYNEVTSFRNKEYVNKAIQKDLNKAIKKSKIKLNITS